MTSIQNFNTLPFIQALKGFFEDLHIPINILSEVPGSASDIFKETFNPENPTHALMEDVYVLGTVDDAAFTQTRKVSENEIKNADYDYLLIMGIVLKNGGLPTRGQLAELTRLCNKIFNSNEKGNPVTVVFRYGDCISFSNAERIVRNTNDYREGEKLGRVSCLKDIQLTNPHAAHQRILEELSIKNTTQTFEGLYEHWRKAFDTKELNKGFFKKIANWYFWSIDQAKFPFQYLQNDERNALKTDEQLQNLANQKALIRFITRIIFVWFLKEKKLIPETLFQKDFLKNTLNNTDDDASDYYNAILQNLFFATLNRSKDQRAFATDEGFHKNRATNYDVNSLYRYEKMFKNPAPEQIMRLFEEIPFLNGGLFDSLDNKENSLLMDGFSRTIKNRAIMPDRLFFGNETTNFDVKLNEIYDTKSKKYGVKGLFQIFEEYKFTVEENTPLEIDVALDPYLLGEIFENLLAYYNPETSNTARKGTGSFYTPQEIVNYMVDESIKAYLETNVGEINAGRVLNPASVEFNVKFDENTKFKIVKALSEIKILDPACGSGAFPMGVLQRMVQLLTKLDPDNSLWRAIQKEKIIGKKIAELEADKQAIAGLSDAEVRTKAIAAVTDRIREVEVIFNNEYNFDDYSRKLFIIQNCIYGVDIQDVAIQISKLRFFLSLIIDQKNEAIKPLPNLETKFVIANTLIGLEKQKAQTGNIFTNDIQLEVEELGEKLKKLRSQYFELRNRKEKKQLQENDRQLRVTIAQKLQTIGYDSKNAGKIASWDIYDQNSTADWFDMNWMFGITDGFDVVIGNPPYVQLQNESGKLAKIYEKSGFETFERMGDIYSLFYEQGFNFLVEGGLETFITSNKWMRTNYGKTTRNFFTQKTNPLLIIDFGSVQVFESATVDTNILIIQKGTPKNSTKACRFTENYVKGSSFDTFINANLQNIFFKNDESWIVGDSINAQLISKVRQKGVALKDWDITINYGIKTGLNEAFIIDKETKDRLILQDPNSINILKPILRGKDIQKWVPEFANLWLISTFPSLNINIKDYPAIEQYLLKFGKEKLVQDGTGRKKTGNEWFETQDQISYWRDFGKPKIIYPNMTKFMPFVYDDKDHYFSNDKSFILVGDGLKYLTAVFNSKLWRFCFSNDFPELQGGTKELRKVFFDKIPIKQLTPEAQKPFINLVDKILTDKKLGKDTRDLEAEIDSLVYGLYDLTEAEVAVVEGR